MNVFGVTKERTAGSLGRRHSLDTNSEQWTDTVTLAGEEGEESAPAADL